MKYRELQTAYAVLVDWEARREYDGVYRVSMGLPALAGKGGGDVGRSKTRPASTSTSASASTSTSTSASTSADSLARTESRGRKTVRDAVMRIDAQVQGQVQGEAGKRFVEVLKAEEKYWIAEQEVEVVAEVEVEEEQRDIAEEAEQYRREDDPNWGLKHFSPQARPLLGTEPYHSWVPVARRYEHGRKKPKSRRPTYVREMAAKAVP